MEVELRILARFVWKYRKLGKLAFWESPVKERFSVSR